jgi:hypothetical protein
MADVVLDYLNRILEEIDSMRKDLQELKTEFAARVSSYDAILGVDNGRYRVDRRLEEIQKQIDGMTGGVAMLKWVIPLIVSVAALALHFIRIYASRIH